MSRRLNLEITETVEELKELLHQQTNTKLKERVHALYLLKTGQVTVLEALAQVLGRNTSTLYRWFETYKAEGLKGLLHLRHGNSGRPPALPASVQEALKRRLQEPPGFKSYGAIQEWLYQEYGLETNYKTVHQTVRYKLRAKLKVARPRRIHRHEQAGVALKKAIENLPLSDS
jgi:transposase